jgi:hypothetical protein
MNPDWLPNLNRSALITVLILAAIALSRYWIDTTIEDVRLAAIHSGRSSSARARSQSTSLWCAPCSSRLSAASSSALRRAACSAARISAAIFLISSQSG